MQRNAAVKRRRRRGKMWWSTLQEGPSSRRASVRLPSSESSDEADEACAAGASDSIFTLKRLLGMAERAASSRPDSQDEAVVQQDLVLSFLGSDLLNVPQVVIAAHRGDGPLLARLIDAGADVNACDSVGFTSLHWAAAAGDAGVIKQLLSFGADAERKNAYGFTAREIAERNGREDIVQVLTEEKKPSKSKSDLEQIERARVTENNSHTVTSCEFTPPSSGGDTFSDKVAIVGYVMPRVLSNTISSETVHRNEETSVEPKNQKCKLEGLRMAAVELTETLLLGVGAIVVCNILSRYLQCETTWFVLPYIGLTWACFRGVALAGVDGMQPEVFGMGMIGSGLVGIAANRFVDFSGTTVTFSVVGSIAMTYIGAFEIPEVGAGLRGAGSTLAAVTGASWGFGEVLGEVSQGVWAWVTGTNLSRGCAPSRPEVLHMAAVAGYSLLRTGIVWTALAWVPKDCDDSRRYKVLKRVLVVTALFLLAPSKRKSIILGVLALALTALPWRNEDNTGANTLTLVKTGLLWAVLVKCEFAMESGMEWIGVTLGALIFARLAGYRLPVVCAFVAGFIGALTTKESTRLYVMLYSAAASLGLAVTTLHEAKLAIAGTLAAFLLTDSLSACVAGLAVVWAGFMWRTVAG